MSNEEQVIDSCEVQEGEGAMIVDLSAQILEAVDSLFNSHEEEARQDFDHLLKRVKALVNSNVNRCAGKHETRDLLAEVLFSRLTRGFQNFLKTGDLNRDPLKAAEFLLGSVLTGTVLDEFASVFDQVLQEASNLRDFHLAGRADFISINELFQLLNAGKHSGRLILERPSYQLDIWLKNGLINFVDPHQFSQRLLRGKGLSPWREIPAALLEEAHQLRASEGIPILFTFRDNGFIKEDEFTEQLRNIGCELIYDVLQNESDCCFSYKAIPDPPIYAQQYPLGVPIMPLLLEGHRRLDDWRHIRRVFPELEQPIEPAPDLFSRIAEMSLSVIEIKVLTLVNGENSFLSIRDTIGLNNFDLGQMFLSFAEQGVLLPPGGLASLGEEGMSVDESLEEAVQALDANEALDAIPDSLDKVFGEEDDGFGLGYVKAARKTDQEPS